MFKSVSAAGRKHGEIAWKVVQKAENAPSRFLPLDDGRIDFNSKLASHLPRWVVLLRQPPLHEPAPHMRERQCAAGVMRLNMQEMQLALGRQGDAQRMAERETTQIRKIGGMHNGAN